MPASRNLLLIFQSAPQFNLMTTHFLTFNNTGQMLKINYHFSGKEAIFGVILLLWQFKKIFSPVSNKSVFVRRFSYSILRHAGIVLIVIASGKVTYYILV